MHPFMSYHPALFPANTMAPFGPSLLATATPNIPAPAQLLAQPAPDTFAPQRRSAAPQTAGLPEIPRTPVAPAPEMPNFSLFPRNELKQLFHNNQAVIYALNLRTFGAEDKNGDGRISPYLGENGTFLSTIPKLDELAALGVNTLHVLPVNRIGRYKRFGDGGSLYATSDYHRLNPEFDTPGNALGVVEEARLFVQEAHKRGIKVMMDVPSCAALDLAGARPDLILKDAQGRPMTPTNWVDIVMFKNNAALRKYYEGYFDLMVNQLGVDGFRVDVARARPTWFWQYFIDKYPDKAWLAESYTEEDQSPLRNLPRDIPETLLKTGFDSFYGQFHIFHSMPDAPSYMNYLLENRAMFQRSSFHGGNDKSFIGSFLTHDDPALMEKGGPLMCLLASGLMATQPWTNPYILDGFTTGYAEHFDIFNFVPRHRGRHPEIGGFLKQMLALRKQYGPVLSQGKFIPIPVEGSNQVIAFARQAQGKTLLVIANKDINARQEALLKIPGLRAWAPLQNLAPEYGRPSRLTAQNDALSVSLGPGRFHVFEINTPNLARQLPAY